MSSSENEPLIKHHVQLQRYYGALESRIGYRLFLGGTRHFGFYDSDKSWPWPITKALRRMEDHLFDSLALESGDNVLDAGCGYGHVAIHLAQRGLRIQCIDIVQRHVIRAQENVHAAGLDNQIEVREGDYHDLSYFEDSHFEGVYTMETLVHAVEPEKVLSEFYRILKPGGHLALYEYDHLNVDSLSSQDKESMKAINDLSAMPANQRFTEGVLEGLLKNAGFEDIVVTDISKNATPLLWLFYIVGYVPYLIVRFLGLEKYFVNTLAGVEAYRSGIKGVYRYTVLTARKPSSVSQRDDLATTSGAEDPTRHSPRRRNVDL